MTSIQTPENPEQRTGLLGAASSDLVLKALSQTELGRQRERGLLEKDGNQIPQILTALPLAPNASEGLGLVLSAVFTQTPNKKIISKHDK